MLKLVPGPLDPDLEPVARILRRWSTDVSRATDESRRHLAEAERASGMRFPGDDVAFMSLVDGGDGFLEPDGASLVLWPARELLEANADCAASQFYPGYFLIGGDGGGEAVALRRSADGEVELALTPLIGRPEDDALFGGRTLGEFLDLYGSGAIWRTAAPG